MQTGSHAANRMRWMRWLRVGFLWLSNWWLIFFSLLPDRQHAGKATPRMTGENWLRKDHTARNAGSLHQEGRTPRAWPYIYYPKNTFRGRLDPFIWRNWNVINKLSYLTWNLNSTTFQSSHISLSQIHRVEDENWFYRSPFYINTLFNSLPYGRNATHKYLSHIVSTTYNAPKNFSKSTQQTVHHNHYLS
jgi:hypothetical protein